MIYFHQYIIALALVLVFVLDLIYVVLVRSKKLSFCT